MREDGFYWVSFKDTSGHWEVARYTNNETWKRCGMARPHYEIDVYQVEALDLGGELPPEPNSLASTQPDEQPVTLVEVWRVLNRLQLENPGRTYSKAQIFADGSGNIEQGNPNVVEWSFGTLEELSAGVRAAITNIDSPPKPLTLDVMRSTK